MSSMKDIMMKSMNVVMLDCDQATMTATRIELENVSFMKRLQLRMHLMGCKYCREYVKQSSKINGELIQMKKVDPENPKILLTNAQKVRLNETIEQSL